MANIAFRFMSWNLKDFGNFNYSSTMAEIVQTILDHQADVVAIIEVVCNRRSPKTAKIDDDLALPGAKTAMNGLLAALKKADPKSGWAFEYTGCNCGNKDRDAYAFYWKSTPQTTTVAPPTGYVWPTNIDCVVGPDIIREDSSGNSLSFSGSRRPGGCQFKFSNTGAMPQAEQVYIAAFHAYTNSKKFEPAKIKTSISNCVEAAFAAGAKSSTNKPATNKVIIGGDLNLNYPDYKTFYGNLPQGFLTAITTDGASSLTPKPDFSASPIVFANKSFDNFLYKNLQCSAKATVVVNVIKEMAKRADKNQKGKNKRTIDELEQDNFCAYYITTTATGSGSATCSISDHFPIVGVFGC